MIKHLAAIILVIILILNSWSNIITNISTHLPGWYDELFIIWIYQNNIRHFLSFDFANIYETNALYPFKYTLSFAEHMYFPSLLVLIINFFTKNPISQYNILLVLNHVLIFLSSLLFFHKLLKNFTAALFSAFYTSYSPYFFVQLGHFQMIFLWPLFLGLYCLADFFERKKIRMLLGCGLFAGIQFLSSVYLGVMGLAIISLWFATELIMKHGILTLKRVLKNYLIFLLVFILISFVSIYGYILVNTEHHIKREYKEYLIYSADLLDYLFPPRNQFSLLYSSGIINNFQNYNRHTEGEFAAFPGILAIIFAIYIIMPKITLGKQILKFQYSLNKTQVFSTVLILVGIIFSLGPRLFIGGVFSDLILPYAAVLKSFPPIGIIRVLARWYFLVILGFSILLGLGYIKLEKRLFMPYEPAKKLLPIFIFLLLAAEVYSIQPFGSIYKNWSDNSYEFVKRDICKQQAILLEYPFHYRNSDADIIKDVNYMAQILLNSTQHNCRILSGYYGFEPSEYIKIRDEFGNGFDDKDIKIINNLNINYVKFNNFAITKDEKELVERNKLLAGFKKVYEDKNTTIFKVDLNETD